MSRDRWMGDNGKVAVPTSRERLRRRKLQSNKREGVLMGSGLARRTSGKGFYLLCLGTNGWCVFVESGPGG